MTESLIRNKNKNVSMCGMCSTEFYEQYFDVSTEDVTQRICYSLFPFTNRFVDVSRNNPDLYGPFWIYTSLIFVLAVAGNLSELLKSDDVVHFTYNFDFLPVAASLIYGFGFGFPILLTFIMKFLGSNIAFVQVICVYGYSYSVFIPIAMVCSYPLEIIRFSAVIYGAVSSAFFLMINFSKELNRYIPRLKYIVILIVGVAQVLFILVFKFYFFSSVYKNPSNTDTSSTPQINNSTNSTL